MRDRFAEFVGPDPTVALPTGWRKSDPHTPKFSCSYAHGDM